MMVTAGQVDNPPFGWNADGAMSLPEIWSTIEQYRPANFVAPASVFATIFYEETACCNMLQIKTPAAIGPGQLQVSEGGKMDFFACQDPQKDNFLGAKLDSSMTIWAVNQKDATVFKRNKAKFPDLPPLTQDMILKDNEFSVKMHVKFFQWMSRGFGPDKKAKGLDGLLSMQAGDANAGAPALFKSTAAALDGLMYRDASVDYKWTDSEWKSYYGRRR